jgi:circadian clock protein KaiB
MKSGENTLIQYERALSNQDKHFYILRLYVSGASPKSKVAINNIKTICDRYLSGCYDLSVVDIYQYPRLAVEGQVVAAPTLVKSSPPPLRRLIGDLSNTPQILHKLGLVREEIDGGNKRSD